MGQALASLLPAGAGGGAAGPGSSPKSADHLGHVPRLFQLGHVAGRPGRQAGKQVALPVARGATQFCKWCGEAGKVFQLCSGVPEAHDSSGGGSRALRPASATGTTATDSPARPSSAPSGADERRDRDASQRPAATSCAPDRQLRLVCARPAAGAHPAPGMSASDELDDAEGWGAVRAGEESRQQSNGARRGRHALGLKCARATVGSQQPTQRPDLRADKPIADLHQSRSRSSDHNDLSSRSGNIDSSRSGSNNTNDNNNNSSSSSSSKLKQKQKSPKTVSNSQLACIKPLISDSNVAGQPAETMTISMESSRSAKLRHLAHQTPATTDQLGLVASQSAHCTGPQPRFGYPNQHQHHNQHCNQHCNHNQQPIGKQQRPFCQQRPRQQQASDRSLPPTGGHQQAGCGQRKPPRQHRFARPSTGPTAPSEQPASQPPATGAEMGSSSKRLSKKQEKRARYMARRMANCSAAPREPVVVECHAAGTAEGAPIHPAVSTLLLSKAGMSLRLRRDLERRGANSLAAGQPVDHRWLPLVKPTHFYASQQLERPLESFTGEQIAAMSFQSPSPPPPRPWIRAPAAGWQTENEDEGIGASGKDLTFQARHEDFTAMSYNVLSDRMVSNEKYPETPELALNWLYRRELILRQLLEEEADVIALQELELEQFETFFEPKLSELGHYDAIFEPKSRAKTMESHQRRRVDGCAIFFKRDRFRLIARHLFEFNQIAMANARGSEAMLNRVMTKDNIGLAAVLEFKPRPTGGPMTTATGCAHDQHDDSRGRRILVCNTHIYWDPEYCDVKLIQTIMLMNELECVARHYANEHRQPMDEELSGEPATFRPSKLRTDSSANDANINNNPRRPTTPGGLLPLVLLGDFNSMPRSGVTNYLTGSKIDSSHEEFKNFKYTKCSNALSTHPLIMARARAGPGVSQSPRVALRQTASQQPAPSAGVGLDLEALNNFRRQSSPAWCFYSPPVTPPASPSLSTSSAATNFSSASSTSSSCGSTFDPDGLRIHYEHPFKLASAYGPDTMPYTNFTTNFKEVIDYVFFSQDSIRLLGLLGPLDRRWLEGHQIRGLPQPHLPSDHLPLVVKLRLGGTGPLSSSSSTSSSSSLVTTARHPAARKSYSSRLAVPAKAEQVAGQFKRRPSIHHQHHLETPLSRQLYRLRPSQVWLNSSIKKAANYRS